MYDPRAPTLAAVEEERKTLCNEEELHDMKDNSKKKKEEHIYPVMSPAPCDDCLSVFSDPEEDFRPLTPSGLDLPTNSVVTFLSSISSPKIPSNPASLDEPPSLTLLPTSQPPTINPDVAPSTSIGSQFSISSPEASQSEKTSSI